MCIETDQDSLFLIAPYDYWCLLNVFDVSLSQFEQIIVEMLGYENYSLSKIIKKKPRGYKDQNGVY